MPYLNIVFHNTQHGGKSINQRTSRADYTGHFVAQMNVFQSNAGPGFLPGAPAAPSSGWGGSVTGAATACGIFLCESPPYNNQNYRYWLETVGPSALPSAIPKLPDYFGSGLSPYRDPPNNLCAFLEGAPQSVPLGTPGAPAAVNLIVHSPHWFGSPPQALRCLGTGAAGLLGPNQAPWGSDRYGILFQAVNRRYPNPSSDSITGVFVHTKNTNADPGTQIAALCTWQPDAIIFGDLNLDLRQYFKQESLAIAVRRTHRILAIQQVAPSGGAGNYYYTRYDSTGSGTACLDYALVPLRFAPYVELWAYRTSTAVPTLFTNHSDHSVMMLRIHCT